MRINPEMFSIEDFDDAVSVESLAIRGLVPDDSGMHDLLEHDGASLWAHRRSTTEFVPVPAQIVTVRKSGHGVRPVAELSVRDRLLYRALVRRWKHAFDEPDRSADAHEKFLSSPLEKVPAATYVVSSDVTACYEYIDHGLLVREVLTRTGDSYGATALAELLVGVMGRSYGLPQQSSSSDVLADVYLSVIERRLLRQGLAVWRYNDDFRIAVDSWSAALNAVDILERELRAAGLTLNDLKTIIRKESTYRRALSRREEVLKSISDEVEIDLTSVVLGVYDEMVVEPEKDAVAVGAAKKVLIEWRLAQEKFLDPHSKSVASSTESDRRLALTDLLRWALSILSSDDDDDDDDDEILTACAQILRTEQTVTPAVARYLEVKSDPPATVEWFEVFLSESPYLTPWQAWWIAPAIGNLSGSYAADSVQRSWLEQAWSDAGSPEPVKAGLALTVARKDLVDVSALLSIYESMSEVGRPFIARAIGAIALDDDGGAATLLKEDEWVRWSFEVGKNGE